MEKQMKSRLIGLLAVENSVEIVDNKVYNLQEPKSFARKCSRGAEKIFFRFLSIFRRFFTKDTCFFEKRVLQ